MCMLCIEPLLAPSLSIGTAWTGSNSLTHVPCPAQAGNKSALSYHHGRGVPGYTGFIPQAFCVPIDAAAYLRGAGEHLVGHVWQAQGAWAWGPPGLGLCLGLCLAWLTFAKQAACFARAAGEPSQAAEARSRRDDSYSAPRHSAKPADTNDALSTGLFLPTRASEPLHDRTMYRTQYQEPLPVHDESSGISIGANQTRPLPAVAYRTTYGSMSVQNSPLMNRQHSADSVSEQPRVCGCTRRNMPLCAR